MKKYNAPIVNITNWKEEDVIRTSFGMKDFEDPFDDDNWG